MRAHGRCTPLRRESSSLIGAHFSSEADRLPPQGLNGSATAAPSAFCDAPRPVVQVVARATPPPRLPCVRCWPPPCGQPRRSGRRRTSASARSPPAPGAGAGPARPDRPSPRGGFHRLDRRRAHGSPYPPGVVALLVVERVRHPQERAEPFDHRAPWRGRDGRGPPAARALAANRDPRSRDGPDRRGDRRLRHQRHGPCRRDTEPSARRSHRPVGSRPAGGTGREPLRRT